jgi:hypothetical protein
MSSTGTKGKPETKTCFLGGGGGGEQVVLQMAEWYVGMYHIYVCKFLWLVKLIKFLLQKKMYVFGTITMVQRIHNSQGSEPGARSPCKLQHKSVTSVMWRVNYYVLLCSENLDLKSNEIVVKKVGKLL